METFITNRNLDEVWLSVIFLHSSIRNNDENIQINRYTLLRASHIFCMHIFKESLPLISRNNISDIKECLVIEIDVNNQMKKMFLL